VKRGAGALEIEELLPPPEAPITAPAVIFFWVSFSPQWGHIGTLSASEKRISLSKVSPQLGHRYS